MQHCDDEVLALVALGEQPSATDAVHLAGCERCRDEVTSLGGLVATVRVQVADGPSVTPPPRVWAQIAEATGVSVTPSTEQAVSARPASVPSASPAPVRLRPRASAESRRPRWVLPAVAASALAVGLVGGVAGSALLRDAAGTPEPPGAQVIAQVSLAALPADPGAQGSAEVVNTTGGRRLRVEVSRLSTTTGFYEVWLIDRGVKKMIPLGILPAAGGEFDIPAGVDLGEYPIVDVSAEPLDGNPTHSGTSLLRGTLPA